MAKPSKQKRNDIPEPVGIPLAGTKADKRLLQALKEDVAPEATPALQFVMEHAKTISVVVVGIVLAAIIGIGYKWHHQNSLDDAGQEIAAALDAGSPESVITALKALVPNLPEELQVGAYNEIVLRVEELGNHEEAAEYWQKIYSRTGDPGFKVIAGLGRAKNLIALEKLDEAARLMDELAGSAGEALLPQIQMEQAVLAERMGDFQKSLELYQTLQTSNNFYSDSFLAAQVEQLGEKLANEQPEPESAK